MIFAEIKEITIEEHLEGLQKRKVVTPIQTRNARISQDKDGVIYIRGVVVDSDWIEYDNKTFRRVAIKGDVLKVYQFTEEVVR